MVVMQEFHNLCVDSSRHNPHFSTFSDIFMLLWKWLFLKGRWGFVFVVGVGLEVAAVGSSFHVNSGQLEPLYRLECLWMQWCPFTFPITALKMLWNCSETALKIVILVIFLLLLLWNCSETALKIVFFFNFPFLKQLRNCSKNSFFK